MVSLPGVRGKRLSRRLLIYRGLPGNAVKSVLRSDYIIPAFRTLWSILHLFRVIPFTLLFRLE